jgi:hypothetical protein
MSDGGWHTHEDHAERQWVSLECLESFETVGRGHVLSISFLHVVHEDLERQK